MMRALYFPVALVRATLAAVAVVCSHNHTYALAVAAWLAVASGSLAMLQRRQTTARLDYP